MAKVNGSILIEIDSITSSNLHYVIDSYFPIRDRHDLIKALLSLMVYSIALGDVEDAKTCFETLVWDQYGDETDMHKNIYSMLSGVDKVMSTFFNANQFNAYVDDLYAMAAKANAEPDMLFQTRLGHEYRSLLVWR